MLCMFCSKPIINKDKLVARYGTTLKYCSSLCNKRAWYMRHNKPKESIFTTNPPKGILWEEWFIKKFHAKRPSESLNTSFDFFLNNEKIDLKVCELYKRKFKRGKPVKKTVGWWTFNRNGSECDFMICIGLVNNKVARVFKIPEAFFPSKGATISPIKSKYDQYAIVL